MIYFILTFLIAIQFTTAQVVAHVPRNAQRVNHPNNQIQNGPNSNILSTAISNAHHHHSPRPAPNNIQSTNSNNQYNPLLHMRNAQDTYLDSNARMANVQMTNVDVAKARMTNAQIANANAKFANAHNANDRMTDAQISNNANARLTNAQIANKISANLAHGQNNNMDVANARLNNAQTVNTERNKIAYMQANKHINDQISKAELANNFLNTQSNANLNARMQANTDWNKEKMNNNMDMAKLDKIAFSNMVNANLANANLANANPASLWALNNLASLNGNMATFSLGNGGQSLTITSGSPNSPPFGIQLLAEALEVGGTVSVNGQIPIYGTVAVNGNVPTDGTASVKYSSARKAES